MWAREHTADLQPDIEGLPVSKVHESAFEFHDIAPSKHGVLKRALQEVSCVQEWLVESMLRDPLRNNRRSRCPP